VNWIFQNRAGPEPRSSQWAMFCHFSAFLGMWFPFGSLIGPLILWQIKRESDPFIDDQGKEAMNFQITVAIASAICYVLMFVLIGFRAAGPGADRCGGAGGDCRGQGQ
jgi:uncharacterized protein